MPITVGSEGQNSNEKTGRHAPQAAKQRPIHVSQTIMITLSALMLFFGFAGLHVGITTGDTGIIDASQDPTLTSGRMENGKHFLDDRRRAPILYVGLHVVPAIIWSVFIPIQHASWIRSRYRRFHRFCGYAVLVSAVILNITGLILPLRGLAYTAPDFWHMHSLRLNPETFPVLAPILEKYVRWPTFHAVLFLVAPPLALTTWRTFATISGVGGKRSIVQHQLWASAHAICGYVISMQRVFQVLFMMSGRVIYQAFGPETGEWLGLPNALTAKTYDEKMRIVRIEEASFALTAWLSGPVMIIWFLSAYRSAGSPKMDFV